MLGLPGDTRAVTNPSITCERESCTRKAALRVQGETDSFGAEYEELCETCYKEDLAKEEAERAAGTHWLQTARCDWCKKSGQPDVCHTRDPDEGYGGPVYLVCAPCRYRRDDADAEELRFMQLRKMGYSSEQEYEDACADAAEALEYEEDEARHLNSIWTKELSLEWKRESFEEQLLGYQGGFEERDLRLYEAALEEDAARSEYY